MNKLLTDNVREILQSQYPNEDLVEIDNCIYHLPHTEEAWGLLRDKVRPGWQVTLEERGLRHYVIYNPEQYRVGMVGGVNAFCCDNITSDIELPINCSTCYNMFSALVFSNDLIFPETFDTSEIVDMKEMFSDITVDGSIILGENFKTDKVKDFSYMFYEIKLSGSLNIGCNFSLENADDLRGMFRYMTIENPIEFGDKFNPQNATCVDTMFSGIKMPLGFNIGNNFHLRKGIAVNYMFSASTFNDDFWLPDCFNIDESCSGYLSLFRHAKLPYRVNTTDYKDIQGIVSELRIKGC